jgi:hypothetical protein
MILTQTIHSTLNIVLQDVLRADGVMKSSLRVPYESHTHPYFGVR